MSIQRRGWRIVDLGDKYFTPWTTAVRRSRGWKWLATAGNRLAIAGEKCRHGFWWFIDRSGPVLLLYTLGLVAWGTVILVRAWRVSEKDLLALQAGAQIVYAGGTFLLGYGVLWVGRNQRKHQEEESDARAKLALNVTVVARVFRSEKYYVLEVGVDVGNPSRRTWCVPVAYISAKPLIDTKAIDQKFDKSKPHDSRVATLGRHYNGAEFAGSVTQLEPDEVEQLVRRFDPLPRAFVERYPVVMVSVEVFGASAAHLGHAGSHRAQWLTYQEKISNEKFHDCGVIERLNTTKHGAIPGFEDRDRCLLKPKDVADVDNSLKFQPMLKDVVQWSRELTVDLLGNTEILPTAARARAADVV